METVKEIFLDARIDSYRKLFSDSWPTEIYKKIGTATKLDQIFSDLLLQWRGAAYTAEFPIAMIDHLIGFTEGYMREHKPNSDLMNVATGLVKGLSRNITEIAHDPGLQQKILETLARIDTNLSIVQNNPIVFTREQIWDLYFKEHVYQITLWSSLRICYVAIYNAYDNFIIQTYKTASGEENCRTTDRNFGEKFKNAFNEELKEKCLTTQIVQNAKLIRHALAHAGGRETSSLQSRNHGIKVQQGELQIWPEDLKNLYQTLKEPVNLLIEHVNSLSQFQ